MKFWKKANLSTLIPSTLGMHGILEIIGQFKSKVPFASSGYFLFICCSSNLVGLPLVPLHNHLNYYHYFLLSFYFFGPGSCNKTKANHLWIKSNVWRGKEKKEREKCVLTMASYDCERHHGLQTHIAVPMFFPNFGSHDLT